MVIKPEHLKKVRKCNKYFEREINKVIKNPNKINPKLLNIILISPQICTNPHYWYALYCQFCVLRIKQLGKYNDKFFVQPCLTWKNVKAVNSKKISAKQLLFETLIECVNYMKEQEDIDNDSIPVVFKLGIKNYGVINNHAN